MTPCYICQLPPYLYKGAYFQNFTVYKLKRSIDFLEYHFVLSLLKLRLKAKLYFFCICTSILSFRCMLLDLKTLLKNWLALDDT